MRHTRHVVAFACGLVFAIGLGISGMTHPSKVMDFLDFAGSWDPSLLCVMGAALAVSIALFPRILRRARPLFDTEFHMPQKQRIDRPLILGAAIFGVGWGLGGFCPGPALVSVLSGATPVLVFVAAMMAGMALFAWVDASQHTSSKAQSAQDLTAQR